MKKSSIVLGAVIMMMAFLPATSIHAQKLEVESVAETVELSYGRDNIIEEFEAEVTFTPQESGLAKNASLPKRRQYSSGAFNGSYGNQLDALARRIYDAIVVNYAQKRSTGTITVNFPNKFYFFVDTDGKGNAYWDDSPTYQELFMTVMQASQSAHDGVFYDHPEIFWMNNYSYNLPIKFTWTGNGNIFMGTVSSATLTPVEMYSGASREVAAFDQAVNTAVNNVRRMFQGTNRFYKVRAIHDYVCEKSYYQESAYAHSAGGFFLHGGRIVCEGYAKAVKVLCDKLGIPCILVVGDAGGPHMWNYILMEDNNWYLLDATWDDIDPKPIQYTYFLAGSNSIGDMGLRLGEERLLRTNFNSSDYAQNFVYPPLSSRSWLNESAGHTHNWSVVSEQKATCTTAGSKKSRCLTCGQETYERLDKRWHSYKNKQYVYNHDATCLRDGTKTLICDNGCGTRGKTIRAEGTKLQASLVVNANSIVLKKGQKTKRFRVSGLGLGDYVRTWTSSNPKIVTVSGKADGTCTIRAKKKTGSAKIKITLASGRTKTVKVKVQSQTVAVKKITGVPKKLKLARGQKYWLNVSLSPFTAGEKLKFTSSNKKVAAVNAKGMISAKKKGKAVITVKAGRKSIKCQIKVK